MEYIIAGILILFTILFLVFRSSSKSTNRRDLCKYELLITY